MPPGEIRSSSTPRQSHLVRTPLPCSISFARHTRHALTAAVAATLALAGATAQAQIDLRTYVRTGIFNLLSATTWANQPANEASAVTY